jgi:hypothetical protein
VTIFKFIHSWLTTNSIVLDVDMNIQGDGGYIHNMDAGVRKNDEPDQKSKIAMQYSFFYRTEIEMYVLASAVLTIPPTLSSNQM